MKKKDEKALATALYWLFIGWWLVPTIWIYKMFFVGLFKLFKLPFLALDKKRLWTLQDILLPESTGKKLLPAKQLNSMAKQRIDDNYRILTQSIGILETTFNKGTFDSRMALACQCVDKLEEVLPLVNDSRSTEIKAIIENFKGTKESLESDFTARTKKQ